MVYGFFNAYPGLRLKQAVGNSQKFFFPLQNSENLLFLPTSVCTGYIYVQPHVYTGAIYLAAVIFDLALVIGVCLELIGVVISGR
jgi:hypothetical protein